MVNNTFQITSFRKFKRLVSIRQQCQDAGMIRLISYRPTCHETRHNDTHSRLDTHVYLAIQNRAGTPYINPAYDTNPILVTHPCAIQ